MSTPDHEQRADHYQYLYEQASEGKCGYSGLTFGACKASICDCFEFPWVKPAPEEHPMAVDANPEPADPELERIINEITVADYADGMDPDGRDGPF